MNYSYAIDICNTIIAQTNVERGNAVNLSSIPCALLQFRVITQKHLVKRTKTQKPFSWQTKGKYDVDPSKMKRFRNDTKAKIETSKKSSTRDPSFYRSLNKFARDPTGLNYMSKKIES